MQWNRARKLRFYKARSAWSNIELWSSNSGERRCILQNFYPTSASLGLTGTRLCQVPLPISLLCGTKEDSAMLLPFQRPLLIFLFKRSMEPVGLI